MEAFKVLELRRAKNEKISNSKYTKAFFTKFIQMGNIESTQNELNVKS